MHDEIIQYIKAPPEAIHSSATLHPYKQFLSSMLDDDACAQVCISNALPTGLDYYDTPERFEMVSLYCVPFYRRSIEAISFYSETPLVKCHKHFVRISEKFG